MTTVTARHRSEGSSPMNTQTDTIPRMIIDLFASPGGALAGPEPTTKLPRTRPPNETVSVSAGWSRSAARTAPTTP